MDGFNEWLEKLAAKSSDAEIEAGLKAHFTEYDESGNIVYEPTKDDIALLKLEHYATLRRGAYGSWQEQLDMQFAGSWQQHVENVKARFVKP